MTSAYDPYHDEDAVNVDVSAAYEKPSSPFSKAFMQMGQAIKNGQFCAINKEDENSKTKGLNADTDRTMDMSYTDDSQHEQRSNDKSVSFSEAEPLIVNDLMFPSDQAEGFESDDIDESKSKVTDMSVSDAKKSSRVATTLSTLIVVASICAGIYKGYYLDRNVSTLVNRIYALGEEAKGVVDMSKIPKFYPGLVAYILENSNTLADLARSVQLSKLIYRFSGALVLLICLHTFFANEKRLKSFIEFVWGVFICSVVMTGIYFTYDFTV